jgi:uncharacterized protein
MEVDGKRVLITGASRGIGLALAEAFAGAGATVALVARSEGPLRDVAERLKGTAHPTDLLDPEQVTTVVQRVEDEAGPVDVLVNNAGIGLATALWELPADDIEQTIRLNLTVPLELCRQAIPRMVRRRGGHIVNVASMAAIAAVPGMTAYAGTKAGLFHATSALRMELAGLPVGLTSVLVGPVPTDLLQAGESTYPPMKRGFDRMRRLQLMPDTPADTLAAAVVKGVVKDRRTVYLPLRAAVFVAAVEGPRRFVDLALTGVPRRA